MTAKEIKNEVLNIIYRHFQILTIPISTEEIQTFTNGKMNIRDIESVCESLQKQGYITYGYDILYGTNRVDSITIDGREYIEGVTIDQTTPTSKLTHTDKSKTPILFISHASNDKPFVGKVLKLIKTLGVKSKDEIVCTSFPDYGFEYGKDWNHEMLKIFTEHVPYTIFVYTRSFFSSPVCMNEVGAVWGLQLKYFGIIPKGGDYNTLKCVIQPTNLTLKVDIAKEYVFAGLDQLKKSIEQHFYLQSVSPKEWEAAKELFYNDVNKDTEEVLMSSNTPTISQQINRSIDMKQRVFEYIRSNQSSSASKIALELGLSQISVRRILQELSSENKIIKRGSGKHIIYSEIK